MSTIPLPIVLEYEYDYFALYSSMSTQIVHVLEYRVRVQNTMYGLGNIREDLTEKGHFQCCQVKIKFPAQSPLKTSPKLAQLFPQIIIKLFILKVATPTDKEGNAFQVRHAQSIYPMMSGCFHHSLQLIATYCSTVNYKCLFIKGHHNVPKSPHKWPST